jgi:hypothetical protein
MPDVFSVGQQPSEPSGTAFASPWWGGSATPVVTIASVFPQACRSEEKFGPRGGFTRYELAAAPRDGVVTLRVQDTGQMLMDWVNREMRLAPITARQVAESLVEKWSGFTLGSKWGRPGIWVCAGLEPTQEEIAQNRAIQESFFRGLVQEASDWFHQGNSKHISDLHRRAAEWLLGSAAGELPWVPKMEFRELKRCPACGEEIKAQALSCKHCQTYLPEFYTKTGLDAQSDPVVMAVLTQPKSKQPHPESKPSQPKASQSLPIATQ